MLFFPQGFYDQYFPNGDSFRVEFRNDITDNKNILIILDDSVTDSMTLYAVNTNSGFDTYVYDIEGTGHNFKIQDGTSLSPTYVCTNDVWLEDVHNCLHTFPPIGSPVTATSPSNRVYCKIPGSWTAPLSMATNGSAMYDQMIETSNGWYYLFAYAGNSADIGDSDPVNYHHTNFTVPGNCWMVVEAYWAAVYSDPPTYTGAGGSTGTTTTVPSFNSAYLNDFESGSWSDWSIAYTGATGAVTSNPFSDAVNSSYQSMSLTFSSLSENSFVLLNPMDVYRTDEIFRVGVQVYSTSIYTFIIIGEFQDNSYNMLEYFTNTYPMSSGWNYTTIDFVAPASASFFYINLTATPSAINDTIYFDNISCDTN